MSMVSCNKEQSNPLLESFETTNGVFRLRITSFAQGGIFLAVGGANYLFEVQTDDGQWREIMTVEHDDILPISDSSLRYANEKVGFVFFRGKYAVTTNGGITWQLWDKIRTTVSKDNLPCAISEVNLESNGMGVMSLKCNLNLVNLSTANFGVDWQP
jgi:hypothetical protein